MTAPDRSRCALHTWTTRPWSLEQAVEAYAAAGLGGVSVWREHLAACGVARAAEVIHAAGLRVPALVRGGFFVADDAATRQQGIDDNRRCLDEAAAIGAEMVVLVVGARPEVPLTEARDQVRDGIAACLAHAEGCGVKLAIEPLHPMYAGDKSCVTSLAQARAIWENLDHPLLGVAADVFHIWFDDALEGELQRAGAAGKLFGFHTCDWKPDFEHPLFDRGLMGEGCARPRRIREIAEHAGFTGPIEVEIFSQRNWIRPQAAWLEDVLRAFHSSA